MKRKLILSLLLCLAMFANADNNPTNLVVWTKNGAKVAYALDEKPKVTFTATDLVIITNSVEVSYPLVEMMRFTYSDDVATTISDLQTGKHSFWLQGESLLFHSLNTNTTVSIHSINGTQVFSTNIQNSGEYSFPISNLIPGVYMVTVNGLTYKILKR